MRDWKIYTQHTLKKLGFRSIKSMGQNFLTRYKVVNDMVRIAKITPDDEILEIGGGLGILTHAIYSITDRLTIIEKDKTLAKHLMKTFPEIEVINADALKEEWPRNIKLISNLPYAISSSMLKKILHSEVETAVVMIQKEVAERCIAKVGSRDYSKLTVLCNLHASIKKFFLIEPDAFFPRPKVVSAIIQISKIEVDTKNTHKEIELLCNNLFSLKRRTLRSVVRGFLKRKIDQPIWDEVPFKDKRIIELTIPMLDDILIYLKENNGWPLS